MNELNAVVIVKWGEQYENMKADYKIMKTVNEKMDSE